MMRSKEKAIGSLMIAKLIVENKRRRDGPVAYSLHRARDRRMQILLLGALVVAVSLWFWFLILFYLKGSL